MENASNALIMAASVLIAVMVISFGTYLFTSFGNASKQINQTIESKNVDEFNEQFLKYETDLNDETTLRNCYDIVSVINLAKNNNEKIYKDDEKPIETNDKTNNNNLYIVVNLVDKYSKLDSSINEETSVEKLNEFISKNNGLNNNGNFSNKYICSVEVSNVTGYVKSITFKEK